MLGTRGIPRSARSPSRDLSDGFPGTCRGRGSKRLFDQRHEDRALWAGDVRTERLATVYAHDARAVDLQRQRRSRVRRRTQEGDDTLRAGGQLEGCIGIDLDQLA